MIIFSKMTIVTSKEVVADAEEGGEKKDGASGSSEDVVAAVDAEDAGGEGGEQHDPENRLNAQILNVSDASVLSVVPGVGLREFLFNGVFSGDRATQERIY